MRRATLLVCALMVTAWCNAAPLSSDAFSQWPAMTQVKVSPDGSHLLYVGGAGDRQIVAVLETTPSSAEPRIVMASESLSEIIWCAWANEKRILCATRRDAIGASSENPSNVYRLVAVDRDAGNPVGLWEKASRDAFETLLFSLHSTDGRSVLIERSNGIAHLSSRGSRPAPQIVRLDVNNGRSEVVVSADRTLSSEPRFWSDPAGNVMMASGFKGEDMVFWTRVLPDEGWRQLLQYQPMRSAGRPIPFALIPGEKFAYAIGNGARHRALFQVDLERKKADRILYEGEIDVERPVMTDSHELIALELNTDRPSAHYLNKRDAGVVASADRLLPDRVNEIADVTPDRQVYVVKSSSDTDAGTYYLLDARVAKPQFVWLGTAYPQVAIHQLPPTRVVKIKAGDKSVRAFLTVPQTSPGSRAPVVLMPDAGPFGRPTWTFNFMRYFLVARGYAVLQLQLRDTESARQYLTVRHDLQRASYDVLISAARWAMHEGSIDARHLAVIGWGYGGYLSLLASQRNANLFSGVIAINAVSDLTQWPSIDELVGNAPFRLSRQSPRGQAARTAAPLLLIYGSRDSVVRPNHASRLMHAFHIFGVKYESLEIAEGGYELSAPSMRKQMLDAVDEFLAARMH